MISTRGRYALRFLVDLAECQGEGFTALKDIASRQEISQKYAERLLAMLSDKNIVDAKHGKGGGYKLNREPKDYKISEILTAMGEELAPVACLTCGGDGCSRSDNCRTLPMWKKFHKVVKNFFDSVTLEDLMQKD